MKKRNEKSSEIVVGLDIGTTKIAVIVGQKNENGKLDILGYGNCPSHGVKRGVIINIYKTIESIINAIQAAEESSDIKITNVFVGIAGQHIKTVRQRFSIMRDNTNNEISQKDISKLNENVEKMSLEPGDFIIHMIPQEYIVDGNYVRDDENGNNGAIGMPGAKLEADFNIVIGQTAAKLNIEKCIQRANLQYENIILEPLASAYSVLSKEEIEAGVVLVDIGGGTTDITIFKDSILRYIAVIPSGGNIVTEDVKEGCSIMRNQAELLKVKFGSALAEENLDNKIISIPGLRGRPPKEISTKNLASIIQARMEEIVGLINQEIKKSGFESRQLIGGIVLTGGGSLLAHVAQLTEFITGIDTRVGWPSEHLSNNIPAEVNSPIYSTTIGLVLRGFEEINHYRENPKKRNSIKGTGLDLFKTFFNTSLFDKEVE